MPEYIRIFDTTLRDGEQSPGASLDGEAKLEIAEQLARLGVDVIEAGFPAASPGDFEAVQTVARHVGAADGPIIAGLARATPRDIDACWEAVRPAARPRIHTFLATSDVHLEHKLRMSRQQVVERVRAMVAHARGYHDDIEFSAEDASRTDPAFLCEVFAAAIEAGATTLNVPDTVGYIQPAEFAELIRIIRNRVPGIERCVLSVHCHDDLGFATANSLAGVQAGARQVECTVNGLGERAGNASLEEIVMALRTRSAYYGFDTGVDARQLTRASHLVAARTGIGVPPNKAVVGANAFAHEAGIHQDGVIKHRLTYEIMAPESVGLAQSRLVLGKHSGRRALAHTLAEIGYLNLRDEEMGRIFARFKELADKKKEVTEADLEALVADEFHREADLFLLHGVNVSCGAPALPTASVSIALPDGSCETRAATGTGPVDAIFSAINSVVRQDIDLLEYVVHAVSGGVDALGEVTVRIRGRREGARTISGHSADIDILVASAKAYLAAVNKLARMEGLCASTPAIDGERAVPAATSVSTASAQS